MAMCCVHEPQEVAGAGGSTEQAFPDLDWLNEFSVRLPDYVSGLDRNLAKYRFDGNGDTILII